MSEEAAAQTPEGATDTGAGGEKPRQEEHSQEGAQPQGGETAQGAETAPEGGSQEAPQGSEPQLAELLPEDLREDETLKSFQSVDEMARKLKELEGQSQGAPEEYDLDVGMPEDVPEELRNAAEQDVEQFKEIAKELGLSNDAAQKLLDYDAQRQANLADSLQQHADNQIQMELDAYKEERGDAFTQDVNNARAFMQAFGDEEVTQWLDETGLGDHPKLIKMLSDAGKMLQEHDVIQGAKTAPGASGTSLADRLYSAPPVNQQKESE